ncbi:Uncharacterised protein [Shigella sonnei]|nr:Uncharacterised protein [Shigella sonnei]
MRVVALHVGRKLGHFGPGLAGFFFCPRQQLATDVQAARLRHHYQFLNFADPVDMMQMKLQMQADHADNLAIQQRQMIAHVRVAQIGAKAHAKCVVVKLRLF